MASSSSSPVFYTLHLLLLWVMVAISSSSNLPTLANQHPQYVPILHGIKPNEHPQHVPILHGKKPNHKCNMFQGKWVLGNKSTPPYNYTSCPFIRPQFDCKRNGRPDSSYLKFEWQPDGCNLPRFNAHDFVRRFRGKKIMFVGDSLMLNQWQSLTCLIHSALPRAKYTLVQPPHYPVNMFHLHDYKISITMEWRQFLVDIVNGSRGRALKLENVNGREWSGADVLVFDSYHWWFYKKSNQPWDYMEVEGKRYSNLDRMVAFKIALESWERWIDRNTNHTKTQVFYQGISPSHYRGVDWGQPKVKGCAASKVPVQGHGHDLHENRAIGMVKSVLSRMKYPAYFLDISQMSHLRPDAHPSVYGRPGGRRRGTEVDCTHWCLPGLPDTWNHLLYASLL